MPSWPPPRAKIHCSVAPASLPPRGNRECTPPLPRARTSRPRGPPPRHQDRATPRDPPPVEHSSAPRACCLVPVGARSYAPAPRPHCSQLPIMGWDASLNVSPFTPVLSRAAGAELKNRRKAQCQRRSTTAANCRRASRPRRSAAPCGARRGRSPDNPGSVTPRIAMPAK